MLDALLGSSALLGSLAWILTYAVHSTLLLGAAWALTSRRVRASERTRELVWRAALFGSLVTTTAQLAGGIEPFAGRFALRGSGPEPLALEATAGRPLEIAFGADATPLQVASEVSLAREAGAPATIPVRLLRRATPSASAWASWALVGLSAGGLAVLVLAAGASLRLRRHLAGRRRLVEGPLVARLEELRARAGVRRRVRLSVSERLRAPVAIGTLRPEICVPRRSAELPRELQTSMLAHELAHLVRFDPLWLTLTRAVETLFYFQPLNRLARRRLQTSAEYLCDAWAVRQTADRIGLARCLVEVAGWVAGETRGLVVCGMADLRSPLAVRIRRILAHEGSAHRPVWLTPVIAVLLAGTVALVPGFARQPEPVRAPASARRPAARPAAPPSAPPAREPAPRTPVALLDELARSLDALEAELGHLREETGRRVVAPELAARIDDAEQRIGHVRERHDHLRTLLNGLVARPTAKAAPRDRVPDDTEE